MRQRHKGKEAPADALRRPMSCGGCRRSIAFSSFYAALLILAVIFAPHAYMKCVFAACALIRLNALRRDCALLPHVRRDETVESIRSTRHEKCNPGAVASVAAVVLATTFAVCCTGLSIAALLMAGNGNNAAVFFLVANLTVWGFAALIGRSAYRTARQSARRSAASLVSVRFSLPRSAPPRSGIGDSKRKRYRVHYRPFRALVDRYALARRDEIEGGTVSVQIRQPSQQPSQQTKIDVQRRPLGQKECAAKVSQALVFGLLIFAAAVAVPVPIAHFVLGYLALKQFYVVAYWAGLQSRLRRGESIEIVTTPGIPRGYGSLSFAAFSGAVGLAAASTIAAFLLYITPNLSSEAAVFVSLASLGLWCIALYLYRRVWPAPVTRAIIRLPLDARPAASAGSDPLAFDLEASQATPNAPTAVHPVSQRRHWWTDTQLRDENKPDTGR